jgi:hypothetical protein
VKLTEKDIERFWSKVDKSGGPDACWPCSGSRDPDGYVQFWVTSMRRSPRAHQVALLITTGWWPAKGETARHSCHTRECSNPAHLKPGTVADNSRDMVDAGRSLRGERNHGANLRRGHVNAIRCLAALGWRCTELATMFGVWKGTTSAIITRRTWCP